MHDGNLIVWACRVIAPLIETSFPSCTMRVVYILWKHNYYNYKLQIYHRTRSGHKYHIGLHSGKVKIPDSLHLSNLSLCNFFLLSEPSLRFV